jgi:hypothetical protein
VLPGLLQQQLQIHRHNRHQPVGFWLDPNPTSPAVLGHFRGRGEQPRTAVPTSPMTAVGTAPPRALSPCRPSLVQQGFFEEGGNSCQPASSGENQPTGHDWKCSCHAPCHRPLGPLGFEGAQHRQTLRPSVDGVRSKALHPFGGHLILSLGYEALSKMTYARQLTSFRSQGYEPVLLRFASSPLGDPPRPQLAALCRNHTPELQAKSDPQSATLSSCLQKCNPPCWLLSSRSSPGALNQQHPPLAECLLHVPAAALVVCSTHSRH